MQHHQSGVSLRLQWAFLQLNTKYGDGIKISFSSQCKLFHLFQASKGWGSHICDRSIGPNALGQSNQSQRSGITDAERQPDQRLFPLPHPQLVPDLLSPATDPVCTGGQRKKQKPHVSTLTHTQPPSQPCTMNLTSPWQTINYWRGEIWWGSTVSTQRTHAFSCRHVALKCLHLMKKGNF